MGRKRISVNQGDRYGRLKVVREIDRAVQPSGQTKRQFELDCDCGEKTFAKLNELRSGDTQSCGCIRGELTAERATSHGYSGHKAYYCWKNMIERCHNPDNPNAHNYMGRGIKVCDEWRGSPKAFCDWAEENGYAKGLELDRRNNDKGYSPENCRFVSCKKNNQNTRRSYWWFADGVRYPSSTDAGEAYGVNRETIRGRCKSSNFPTFFRQRKYGEE